MSKKPVMLVADDEPHVRNVLSLKLRNSGFKVLVAADGAEALAICLEHRVDMLICDYQMPVINGMELCAKLKQNEATQELPVLMLSARGFSILPEELDQTNIVMVLGKPFSPREILSYVQDFLSVKPLGEGGA